MDITTDWSRVFMFEKVCKKEVFRLWFIFPGAMNLELTPLTAELELTPLTAELELTPLTAAS